MKIGLYKILSVLLILVCCPLFLEGARGQTENLEEFFSQAQAEPELRVRFIVFYIQQEGLPEHVVEIMYSERIKMLAASNPLVRTKKGSYSPTSHALAIGRGYPSRMTFGPKMFHPAFNYADFLSVIQHEAAHAKFWATGELNYLDNVDTTENSKVRLKGLFPILFELDALKTQMNHPSWQETSVPFRKGQLSYQQKWLDKLAKLEQQSYTYDMKPLLERIRRTYK
jgi:hypothetical protein